MLPAVHADAFTVENPANRKKCTDNQDGPEAKFLRHILKGQN
jgi:hypothetical protein